MSIFVCASAVRINTKIKNTKEKLLFWRVVSNRKETAAKVIVGGTHMGTQSSEMWDTGETTQRERTKTSHQEPAGSKSTLIRTIHKELRDSGKSCARRSARTQSFSDTKSVPDTSQFSPLIGWCKQVKCKRFVFLSTLTTSKCFLHFHLNGNVFTVD